MNIKDQLNHIKVKRILNTIKPQSIGKYRDGLHYSQMSVDMFINGKYHNVVTLELVVNGQPVSLYAYKRVHKRFIFAVYKVTVGGLLLYSRELNQEEIQRLSV
jgi:hypothetical protein